MNPSSAWNVDVAKPVPKMLASAPGEMRLVKLAAFTTPLVLIVGNVGVNTRIA